MLKNIYEVKISAFKWEYVLADSIHIVDAYCKENNFADWRMVGMLSHEESSYIRKTAKEI